MRSITCLILLSFLTLPVFAQETITLTTYYPAPFGVYNELRSKRMAIGPDYYDQSQYPSFVDDGSQGATEIGRYADLVVQRYLGIGTPQPDYELHIKERPMASGNGNSDRPRIVLEDHDVIPGSTPLTNYRFELKLKSPRSDNKYGLNFYFPMYNAEPADGMFMQVEEDQNVHFLGDVYIAEAGARPTPARVGIGTVSPSTGEQALKLDVQGAVGATHYCDANGNNCVEPPIGGGVPPSKPFSTTISCGASNNMVGLCTYDIYAALNLWNYGVDRNEVSLASKSVAFWQNQGCGAANNNIGPLTAEGTVFGYCIQGIWIRNGVIFVEINASWGTFDVSVTWP